MHYLAYGSNLHPLRLAGRVQSPCLVGTTKLDGCRLTFHKRSTDGSSKCNLDFSGDASHEAYGAVYEIPEDEIYLLDKAEGLGQGYHKQQMKVVVNGKTLLAFVYLASPSHLVADLEPYDWYKEIVLAGARKHSFPAAYIQSISSMTSKPDQDVRRRLEMHNLLATL